MKKQFILFLSVIIISMNSTLIFSQNIIKSEYIKKQIDSLITPLLNEKLASGTILISINGSIVFLESYGMADIENNIPCNKNTKYKLASLTKTFTALSIMQLQEQGKLDLNDNIFKYFPDYLYGKKISIFNLLTHTSGLPSYFYSDNKLAEFEEIIERIKTLKPQSEAGEIFNYSNSGYALLTYIIEKVSGMEYGKYIKQNIFDPSKMTNSGIISTTGVNIDLAQGYSIEEYKGVKKSGIQGQLGKGDGALYSSVLDLYNYIEALYCGKLISASNLEKMFSTNKESYGLGWIIENNRKYKIIYHHGGSCGIMTNLKTFFTNSSRITVICLFNNDFLIKSSLNEQIENIAIGEPWSPIFKNSKETIKSFESYLGVYSIDTNDNFILNIENDKIFFQNNNLKKCEAQPLSDSSIYVKETNSIFKFIKMKNEMKNEINIIGFIGNPETIYLVEGKRISY